MYSKSPNQSVFYLNEKHFSNFPGEMKFELLHDVMGNPDSPLVVCPCGPIVLPKHLHQPSSVTLLRLPEKSRHLSLHEELNLFIFPATGTHLVVKEEVCTHVDIDLIL